MVSFPLLIHEVSKRIFFLEGTDVISQRILFHIINNSSVKKNFREKFPVYIHLSSAIIFEEKPIKKKKKKELHI